MNEQKIRCPRCWSSRVQLPEHPERVGYFAYCLDCGLSNWPYRENYCDIQPGGIARFPPSGNYVSSGPAVDFPFPFRFPNGLTMAPEGNCPDCGAPIYGYEKQVWTSGGQYIRSAGLPSMVTYSCPCYRLKLVKQQEELKRRNSTMFFSHQKFDDPNK